MSIPLAVVLFLVFILAVSMLFSYHWRVLRKILLTLLLGSMVGLVVFALLDRNQVFHSFAQEDHLVLFVGSQGVSAFGLRAGNFFLPTESEAQLTALFKTQQLGTLERYDKIMMLSPAFFQLVTTVRLGETTLAAHDALELLQSPAPKQVFTHVLMRTRAGVLPDKLQLMVNTLYPTNDVLHSKLLFALFTAALETTTIAEHINKGAVAVRPSSITFYFLTLLPQPMLAYYGGDLFGNL